MKDIALIAFDQFTDIDLFLMWDILGRNSTDWRVRILGLQPAVRSAHGLVIETHGPLTEASKADAVLFASGKQGVPAALADPAFLSGLSQLDPARQHIGSMCAGVFILERLGLLPTRRATTHPEARPGLLALGLEPVDRPLVCHGKVASAGGCLSAIYLVGWLIESLFGTAKRRETLLPVLPAGQQAVFERLIDETLQ